MAAWGHPGMAAVPAEITEEKLQEKGKLVVFCTIRKLSNVYLEPKGSIRYNLLRIMICLNKGPGLGLQCQSLNSGRYTLGDRLQQLVALLVYWRIFVKVFVSTTEFCRRKMLQKIKSDRIYATCCSNKILLHCQRFFTKVLQYTQSDLSLRVVVATCCHN